MNTVIMIDGCELWLGFAATSQDACALVRANGYSDEGCESTILDSATGASERVWLFA